jgi:hypothetical protein
MKIVLVPLLLSAALAGCDRTHMSANYGVAERSAFRAQVIHPDAGNQVKPEQPLDPEEAATIAKTYRKSLVPQNTNDTSVGLNQVLIVPTARPGAPAGTNGSP